jgi:hypothetical protein
MTDRPAVWELWVPGLPAGWWDDLDAIPPACPDCGHYPDVEGHDRFCNWAGPVRTHFQLSPEAFAMCDRLISQGRFRAATMHAEANAITQQTAVNIHKRSA